MTALGDWLDACEFIGPAKWYRQSRRLGGPRSTSGLNDRPRLIVIHTMEAPERDGAARSTAMWVKTSGGDAQVSCHFTADNAEAIRCVEDRHAAFTQGSPWNDMSLSIEQAGYARQEDGDWHDAYSNGQRHIVARIVAAWCERWHIPPVFVGIDGLVDWQNCTGITTHAAIARASQRPELAPLGYPPGNHTDPGPNYPMDELLAEVIALLGPTTPTDPAIPPISDEDDMTLYVTNSEPRTEGGLPYPPLAIIYAIDPFGKLRNVKPAEWNAAKAKGATANPTPNNELDFQSA